MDPDPALAGGLESPPQPLLYAYWAAPGAAPVAALPPHPAESAAQARYEEAVTRLVLCAGRAMLAHVDHLASAPRRAELRAFFCGHGWLFGSTGCEPPADPDERYTHVRRMHQAAAHALLRLAARHWGTRAPDTVSGMRRALDLAEACDAALDELRALAG